MGVMPPASQVGCGRYKQEADGAALGSGEERANAVLPRALERSRSQGGAGEGPGGRPGCWPFHEKQPPAPRLPGPACGGKTTSLRGGQVQGHHPPLPAPRWAPGLRGPALPSPAQSPLSGALPLLPSAAHPPRGEAQAEAGSERRSPQPARPIPESRHGRKRIFLPPPARPL